MGLTIAAGIIDTVWERIVYGITDLIFGIVIYMSLGKMSRCDRWIELLLDDV